MKPWSYNSMMKHSNRKRDGVAWKVLFLDETFNIPFLLISNIGGSTEALSLQKN